MPPKISLPNPLKILFHGRVLETVMPRPARRPQFPHVAATDPPIPAANYAKIIKQAPVIVAQAEK